MFQKLHSAIFKLAPGLAGALLLTIAYINLLRQDFINEIVRSNVPTVAGNAACIAVTGLLAVIGLLSIYVAFERAPSSNFMASDTGSASEQDSAANERLARNVQKILELVAAAASTSGRYSEILAKAEIDLKTVVDPAKVRSAVKTLLAENAAVKNEVGMLKGRLEQARNEADELRKDLERARNEGEVDCLTKLKNRRWFDHNFAREVAAARETGDPLSLAILDIDHFKRINDTFGHQSGDVILTACGNLLKQSVKGRDTAARYGGEEFAICLPRTDLRGASKLMEGIRQELQRTKWTHTKTGREIGVVTASIGIAQMRSGETVESVFDRADANLYAAKSSGRNRTVGTS